VAESSSNTSSNSATLSESAAKKQAEAADKANAEYISPTSPVAGAPAPQLPDLTVLKEQQEVGQGGTREASEIIGDDVKVADDGSRSSK
jgi:hypothetical protein